MAKKNSGYVDHFSGVEYTQTTQKKDVRGRNTMLVVVLALLLLVILMIMVRMDVGGVGSKVLRPVFKDVPIVNGILPEPTDAVVSKETGYRNLNQAVERIHELEAQVDMLQKQHQIATTEPSTENQAEIEKLKTKINQLQVYEDNQKNFEATKESFYKEVVYNDQVNVEDYIKWYESMDADTAAKLYKEAVQTKTASDQEKELAKSYAKMDPAAAAAILDNMTGDIDAVVNILNAMNASERGAIMGEMNPMFAAKITKKMSN